MIKITNPADCCGCTACTSICSHNAISMQPDTLGFLYPKVDETICINCGLCEKVCAFNDSYDKSYNLDKPIAYAAHHKDIHEVETCRSGAAFIVLSDYIIERGGVIYGAGYTDHFRAVQKGSPQKKNLMNSKEANIYSNLSTIFKQRKVYKIVLSYHFSQKN